MNAVQKYLARYAEPEATLAAKITESYAAMLVVPALDEAVQLLNGYREAARGAPGRVLLILVVNANPATSAKSLENNQLLLRELSELASPSDRIFPGVRWIRSPDFDLLSVDRSSPGRELPRKQGVGLARKIGMDLGLALYVQGNLESPWLFSTDADATLPSDYFSRAAEAQPDSGGILYPFCHRGPADRITEATLLYEAALRFRVLGLGWAGSPYAYHSVGSAVSVRAQCYAEVRGVPRLEAGEDFYLLDKLGKVAPLERLSGEPIRIRARRSDRVPFGTGPRTSVILTEGQVRVPDPRAFMILKTLLNALGRFGVSRDERELDLCAQLSSPIELQAAQQAISVSGILNACRDAAQAVGTGDLRRRLMSWFDALRTVRFLHALRDQGLPDLPLGVALERAPFTPTVRPEPLEQALGALGKLEQCLPARTGPAAKTWDTGGALRTQRPWISG